MLTVFLHADFSILIFINLRQLPRLCLFSLFASFKYIFFEFYSATTQFLRKELSGH